MIAAPPACIADHRERARARLPRLLFDYIDGGSYNEIRLTAGDSLYFDSRLSHLCYTTGGADATLLWVWCETG